MRIQGGLTLVDGQLAEAGVRVDEAAGVIDAVGAEGGNGRCFDARGLYVLPGIVDAGFQIDTRDSRYMRGAPKIAGWCEWGVASPA